METNSILPILQKIPLFADLSEAEHKEIIKNVVMNYYPMGHVFFNQGQAVDGTSCTYIIKRGMVKISRHEVEGGDEKEVTVLADNDFFGEMAFVLNEPRNATATAVAECEVFELKKEHFIKLMEESPTSAVKISAEFIHRVKENNTTQS